ncbi:fimbrial protein [Providencia sp. Me31A]|uniref:fimbrial protein n=1 Tax=Providencia sp. Me31A TaxID=3392637 RepID=UPI003D2C70CF
MKLINFLFGSLVLMSISSFSNANTVTVGGSIVETACSIDFGSRDQTIDMGSLPLAQIQRYGESPPRDFTVRLINCSIERPHLNNTPRPNWRHLRITFDGSHEKDLFKLFGQARGVGLRINDGFYNIAYPGVAMPPQGIEQGTKDLKFQLRLIPNKDAFRSGLYNAQIRFKIDYE